MAPPRNRRPGFSRRAQYGLFITYVAMVVGALVGAALLLISEFNPAAFAWLRGAASEVTTPVASAGSWVQRGVASVPSGVGQYFGVVSENQRLKAELAANRDIVMRARALAHENSRLRAVMKLRDPIVEPVARARLVSSTASSTRRYGILNAGSNQGVRPGQPVRGPEGLIGRVIETSFNTSRVLLAVDPESVVPVRRLRDGLPAFAHGRGDGLIDVRSADIASVQFQAGDIFVTSGTGGVFPPNIPVARVIENARDTVRARAYANPNALDFALVTRPFLPPPPQQPPVNASGAR